MRARANLRCVSGTWLIVPVAVLLVSCRTPEEQRQKLLADSHYVEYRGEQHDWPVSADPVARMQHTKYGIPIYFEPPNRHYEIVGVIQATGRQSLKRASRVATAVGAQAILVAKHKSFSEAGIELQPNVIFRAGGSSKTELVQGILIRWKE